MPLILRTFSAITVGLCLAGTAFDATAADKPRTLAFVVKTWNTAIYESRFMDECPEGVAIGNDEIWWKALSPRERDNATGGGDKEAAEQLTVMEPAVAALRDGKPARASPTGSQPSRSWRKRARDSTS